MPPSEAQRLGRDRFLSSEWQQAALSIVRAYAKAGGLDPSSRGRTWGVTLSPASSKVLLRLNVGRQEALTVRAKEDGGIECRVLASFDDDAVEAAHLVEELGHSVREREQGLRVACHEYRFEDPAAAEAFIRRAGAPIRSLVEELAASPLQQPNWHSPYADALLDS